MIKKNILVFFLLCACSVSAFAHELRLPSFFSNGMVLQRDTKVAVWGWGTPKERVTIEFKGKKATATVKADGSWKAFLPKMEASGEGTDLTVREQGTGKVLTISNVLVGDVFLCSGQSNMELPIRRCMDKVAGLVKDYSNSQIRYVKLPHQFNYVRPNEDCRTLPWQDITPQNCSEVSAICYFMARELQEEKHVPIGIVNSAVGGTRVESWMPQEVLASFPRYKDEFRNVKYHQENWVDSIRGLETRAAMKWERDMMAGDTVVNRWRNEGYDFSTWKDVDIFADWSERRLGSYWFRFTVDVDSPADAVLRMGAMKDADTIFVNGKYVGNTTYEYPPRIYKVKGEYLRKGKNEIMVHLMAQGGRPNFTSGKLYQLEVGDRVYKIGSRAQMCLAKQMPPRPASTYFVDCPTGLYNAMIAPLRDFAFKGILWYQGESNQGMGDYADYLAAMVKSWRKQFGRSLPVVVMQLPGYMSRHSVPVLSSGWCDMREEQSRAVRIIPKAGLCSTLDTGEWNDIHPQDKHLAGHRAALQMRKLAYGESRLTSEGPKPLWAKAQVGGSILVMFDDGQTKTITKATPTWSLLYKPSNLLLDFPVGVPPRKGVILRYCYDDFPEPEIFGKTGIPAPQFMIEVK